MVAILLIASVSIFAQDNGTSAEWGYTAPKVEEQKESSRKVNQESKSFTIDSLYQNKSDMIIYSKVIEFPGKTKSEILNGVKNWASVNFVSLKEVLVSESDDQLVLNYITKSFYIKTLGMRSDLSWYVRLVVEFKDGKARVTFIDDGNAFWPGNQYAPATQARSYKLQMYFKKEDNLPTKATYNGLVEFKNNVVYTCSSIKLDEMKKNKDNW